MPNLKIAFVTDIHAHSADPDDPKRPSYISTSSPKNNPAQNPLAGLQHLIREQKLSADLLICGGDIGDKADPQAQVFIWSELVSLKDSLEAEHLLAATGNHDVDSRFCSSAFDPKGTLQSLVPAYPGLTEDLCDRYWSRNFIVLCGEDYRILLLNSAAYHGFGNDKEKEFEQGRVSRSTVDRIKAELESTENKPINIMVCHHHPLRNDDIPVGDYSEMHGGDLLINLLGCGDFGDWVVLHGHKHYPRIWYSGSASMPVIFSGGSLSARLYSDLATRVRNQFYIVEFPIEDISSSRSGVLGTVSAWDWSFGNGWQHAKRDSGIPHRAGFGCRLHPDTIAHDIATHLGASPSPVLQWKEIEEAIPHVKFVPPKELSITINKLKSNHSVHVSWDDYDCPDQASLRKPK